MVKFVRAKIIGLILIKLTLTCTSNSTAQEIVFFNKDNKQIELVQDETIYFANKTIPRDQIPRKYIFGGVTIGDSVAHIIGHKKYMDGIFYRQKTQALDSLVILYKAANANRLSQKKLMMRQIEVESTTNDRFIEQLQIKNEIAEDAIAELKKRNFKSLLYTFGIGLAAGYLWSDGRDNNINSYKVLGAGFASVGLALWLNIN